MSEAARAWQLAEDAFGVRARQQLRRCLVCIVIQLATAAALLYRDATNGVQQPDDGLQSSAEEMILVGYLFVPMSIICALAALGIYNKWKAIMARRRESLFERHSDHLGDGDPADHDRSDEDVNREVQMGVRSLTLVTARLMNLVGVWHLGSLACGLLALGLFLFGGGALLLT